MALFDKFRKKTRANHPNAQQNGNDNVQETKNLVKSEKNAVGNTDQCENDGFYFENLMEFTTYVNAFKPQVEVMWLSDDRYAKEVHKGYQLVEQKQYKEAIAVLNAALQLNPIGLNARFETCEAYIKLHDMPSAKKTLLNMKDYLSDAKDIAKFYRRLGYIETENKNHKISAACYLYSMQFENHPIIINELMYIISLGGNDVIPQDAVSVLSNNGIPLLSPTNI